MNTYVKINQPNTEDGLRALDEKLEKPLTWIRERAFELFERRGCEPGHEVEDWLSAERELFEVPMTIVTETPDEIEIRMAVSGFSAEDLQVTALPETVTVEGNPKLELNDRRADAMASRTLFRHVVLPRPIQPNAVTSTIEIKSSQGPVLVIAAKKVKPETKNRQVPLRPPVEQARAATA